VCTLIALHQVHRELPLIVAANRDELYARPAGGPEVLAAEPRVVGGRDLEKGGTWLGVSARGWFVGLTNQRSTAPPDASLRSRGEIVLHALEQPGLDAALTWLGGVDARRYNAFNLFLGDAHRLYVAYARPTDARIELVPLEPGIWTLPNDRIGSPEFPKVDRAALLAQPLTALPWAELVPAAQTMLADHAVPDDAPVPQALPPWLSADDSRRLQALCVHTPVYGTRSATLLAISSRGAPSKTGSKIEHYLHAEGPPCQAPLVDHTSLLHA
jgi:uncharacterized protein with NRDE domain